MSWLSSFFRHQDPAKAASQEFDKIPGAMEKYEQPAYDRGERAGSALENYYNSLMNPQEHYNQLMSGYEPSEAYKFKQGEMSTAAANTAAAGGMRGSGADQLNQSKLTQALLSQDMQNYLNNLRGMETEGGQGEAGLYGAGLGAGRDMANTLANLYGTKGDMAYRAAMEHNQRPWEALKGLGSLAGTVGGFMLGGPAGAAAGSGLANSLMNMGQGSGQGQSPNWGWGGNQGNWGWDGKQY